MMFVFLLLLYVGSLFMRVTPYVKRFEVLVFGFDVLVLDFGLLWCAA